MLKPVGGGRAILKITSNIVVVCQMRQESGHRYDQFCDLNIKFSIHVVKSSCPTASTSALSHSVYQPYFLWHIFKQLVWTLKKIYLYLFLDIFLSFFVFSIVSIFQSLAVPTILSQHFPVSPSISSLFQSFSISQRISRIFLFSSLLSDFFLFLSVFVFLAYCFSIFAFLFFVSLSLYIKL